MADRSSSTRAPIPDWARDLGSAALIAVFYLIGVQLGLAFVVQPEGIAVIWPASGILLAALLVRERRTWPLILATAGSAQFLAGLVAGRPPVIALGLTLANLGDNSLAAWLLLRSSSAPWNLHSLCQVVRLIGLATIVSNTLTALLGAAIVSLGFDAPFWSAWRVWMISEALGIVVVAPPVLLWMAGIKAGPASAFRPRSHQIVEAALLSLLLVTSMALIFWPALEIAIIRSPYLIFPLLLWAALRFGPHGATGMMLVVSIVAVWGTIQNLGPSAGSSQTTTERVLETQAFLGVAALSTLVLAAVLAERQRTEAALRESELRYRSLVIALDAGVVHQQADGSIQFWNSSAERILGLSGDQLQGRTSMDPRWRAIHEDGSPFPGETHPAMVTLRTGQPCDNVIMGVHKPDGALTWIKIGSRPLFCPDAATPSAVVTSFTDITDRKRLEEELSEREAQFRLLMAHSLDAVLLTAPNGQILAANPGATEMFGYTEEELCVGGRDLIIDIDDPRFASMLAERTRTGVFRGELNHRRRNGTIFPAEISSALFCDRRGEMRTSIIIRDVSERKRAEEALRESEERFARVFRSSPVGISITTLADGRLVDINESCERILGYTRAEIAGRTTTELGIWRQSDERSHVVRAIREHGFFRNWGTQFVNKASQVRDALVSMERIDVRNQPCLLTMVYDITEWRQLERERERLIAQLNQSLERTDTLYQIAALLNRPYEIQEVLQTVVDSAAAILLADRTILITVDVAAQQVKQRLEGGPGAIEGSTISFTELWEGLSGITLRERRSVLSFKGASDDRESEAVRQRRAQEQAGSILVVPLLTQTTLFGTLTAINRPDDPDFSEQDTALLTALAQQAASVIERAQLLDELRYQATTDGLTQLLNRRAWIDYGERAVAAARRSLCPLTVILLDADHFKQVNDTYGHDVGDAVLQTIAECCRRAVRRNDVAGRYGGEEFVILLPETDASTAYDIADRIRTVVAAERIPIPQGEMAVTISLGVATIRGEDMELSTLLTKADQALYSAKQAGRNCVRLGSS